MEKELLIKNVCDAIAESIDGNSALSEESLGIDGMVCKKTKCLLSNLGSIFGDNLNYLEVGSWKGSSLVAALHGKKDYQATAYENFSEFVGDGNHESLEEVKASLYKNTRNLNVSIREEDFFSHVVSGMDGINLYFYDGQHSFQAQYYAIIKAREFLSDLSIVVIDDFHCAVSNTKMATLKAIFDAGFEIEFMADLFKKVGVFILSK